MDTLSKPGDFAEWWNRMYGGMPNYHDNPLAMGPAMQAWMAAVKLTRERLAALETTTDLNDPRR